MKSASTNIQDWIAIPASKGAFFIANATSPIVSTSN